MRVYFFMTAVGHTVLLDVRVRFLPMLVRARSMPISNLTVIHTRDT